MSKIFDKHRIGDSNVSFVSAPLISVPNSTIVNRAQIRDLVNDMGARMGVDRIQVQSIIELQNEFGSNGERVFSALNDDRGLIRFVGNWSPNINTNGPTALSTSSVNDYAEIVFYGTGLNLLWLNLSGRDIRATIDGGAEGANLVSGSISNILGGRNYPTNTVIAVASGLSLGLHTVKLRIAVSDTYNFYGFEILNESSTIRVNAGSLVKDQKKFSLESAITQAFKPATLTGTRGGRVVVYSSGGQIQTAVQAVDASQATYTSANHSNEEIIRTYYPREFGAGRTDDHSLVYSASNKAFTLDDGTTSLVGSNCSMSGSTPERITPAGAGSYYVFTFVGTGLDILANDNGGGALNTTVTIDGGSSFNITESLVAAVPKIIKIASGLTYGTHAVKVLYNTASSLGAVKFITYGPKKPTLPTGAVELADYNVVANYSVLSSLGFQLTTPTGLSIGTFPKASSREHLYVGAGWSIFPVLTAGNQVSGFVTRSATAGDYYEYTFFGTGFELNESYESSCSQTVRIDGALYTGAATVPVASGAVWTPGTSTFSQSGAGGSLSISGLTLGVHTLRVTTVSGIPYHAGIHIITPIHSPKSNLLADLQNTLPVGSCSLSDSRQYVQSNESPRKAWAQAVGVASSPSTSSTVFIPMPDMSLILKTSGGPIEITYTTDTFHPTQGQSMFHQVYVDGVAVGSVHGASSVASSNQLTSDQLIVPVSPGVHKIDLYWFSQSGAAGGANGTRRNIKAREL